MLSRLKQEDQVVNQLEDCKIEEITDVLIGINKEELQNTSVDQKRSLLKEVINKLHGILSVTILWDVNEQFALDTISNYGPQTPTKLIYTPAKTFLNRTDLNGVRIYFGLSNGNIVLIFSACINRVEIGKCFYGNQVITSPTGLSGLQSLVDAYKTINTTNDSKAVYFDKSDLGVFVDSFNNQSPAKMQIHLGRTLANNYLTTVISCIDGSDNVLIGNMTATTGEYRKYNDNGELYPPGNLNSHNSLFYQ